MTRGIPAPRTWTRAELGLAGVLLALAAAAWLAAGGRLMPEMAPGLALFLPIWLVMMAAMMLPVITPFTVGLSRMTRAGPTVLASLTAGYLLVWGLTGVPAYLLLRTLPMDPRVGGVVLLVAGAYQFTPLKRWCLVRCRSPLALLVRYGETAARGPAGALRVGAIHGGYCLGCCWALMAVLVAAGAMSLAWMAGLAAVIAVEKIAPRGEVLAYALGGVLVVAGVVLLAV
ncbi:DUF2182 domain-containing protein [Saccharopolyspora taberi]|uniref:DUF2182 domain-containing protein n=1 Tax=Saccharopolyspora taberi TaxID=60895 RepID=A0ABN3VGZ7_9PSEU